MSPFAVSPLSAARDTAGGTREQAVAVRLGPLSFCSRSGEGSSHDLPRLRFGAPRLSFPALSSAASPFDRRLSEPRKQNETPFAATA